MQSVCKHRTLGKKWREGRRQAPQSRIPPLLQGKRKGVEGARNRRDGRKRREIQAFEQSAEGLFSAERRGKNSPLGGQQVAALQLLRGCWEMVVSVVSVHLSAGTVWLATLLEEGLFSAPFSTLTPITDSRSAIRLLSTVSFLSQCVLSHLREDVLIFDSQAAKALSDENGKLPRL